MTSNISVYEKLRSKIAPEDFAKMQAFACGDPVKVYNEAAERVPAYRSFLKKNCGDIPEVKTIADFKMLPLMDKQNYMYKHSYDRLCLNGSLSGKHAVYLSSGTTQRTTHWPKLAVEEKFAPLWFYSEMERAFNIDKIQTLFIVSLPLGPWISGNLISNSLHSIVLESEHITLITPGFHFDETIEVIQRWCPYFKQTVFISYPDFAKSILDKLKSSKAPVPDYNMKLVLIGEGYSQEFKNYVNRIMGYDEDNITSIWSMYGSSDFGMIGKETPITVLAGREIYKKNLGEKIFGQMEIPSICQYDDRFLFLEEVDEELVITRFQGVPLIRYRTGDRGKIFSYESFLSILNDAGINVANAFAERNISLKEIPPMPFVIVYGRLYGGVKYHGMNIRVEQIKGILESDPELAKTFTGRFSMSFSRNDEQEPVLNLYLEKKDESVSVSAEEIASKISIDLAKRHAAYAFILEQLGEKAHPTIFFTGKDFFNRPKVRYIQ